MRKVCPGCGREYEKQALCCDDCGEFLVVKLNAKVNLEELKRAAEPAPAAGSEGEPDSGGVLYDDTGMALCDEMGNPISGSPRRRRPEEGEQKPQRVFTESDFGTFGSRAAALALDALVCLVIFSVVLNGADLVCLILFKLGMAETETLSFLEGVLLLNIVPLLYFVILEGSPLKATPGKVLMRLETVDGQGEQLPVIRALVRHLGKYLLFIGFVFMFFTEKKQCLHDLPARSLVLRNEATLTAFLNKACPGYEGKIDALKQLSLKGARSAGEALKKLVS